MEIKDLKGKIIPVTDLDLAILQAGDYCYNRLVVPAYFVLEKTYKRIGGMSTKHESHINLKNCAALPLAAFIRNRQDGVLGRLTFNKSSPPFSRLALLKNRHVSNTKMLVKLKERWVLDTREQAEFGSINALPRKGILKPDAL